MAMMLESGSEVCPKCGGDNWKTAKMVVLEGTTNLEGRIEGKMTDPGAFSGGIREFLLSDRWFSWDQNIKADTTSISSTGLVGEIRKLLVACGEELQLPPKPVEPKTVGIFERIRPVKPTFPTAPPSEPTIPNEPVVPTPRPWYQHFWAKLKFGAAVSFILGLIIGFFTGPIGFFGVIAVWILFIPFQFVSSFTANKDEKKEYDKLVASYPNRVEAAKRSWRDAKDEHVIAIAAYEKRMEEYKMDCDRAQQQEKEERQAATEYQTELANYEKDRNDILNSRELLWERARVCMRCGTAYLGN